MSNLEGSDRTRRSQPDHLVALDEYRERLALDQPIQPTDPILPEKRQETVLRLIESLLAERKVDHLGFSPDRMERMKADPREARRLLQALLTVRPPDPLPESFLSTLDGFLQLEPLGKDVVAASRLPRIRDAFPNSVYPAADNCALWQGDITRLGADAIVNAANSRLLGCLIPFHTCIDNVIHSAAGPRLREDCETIIKRQGFDEPTGSAKATRGYNLPARYVLHTVGPIVGGALRPEHAKALASCYTSCLDLAARLSGARSVAFCSISTGVFGYPKEAAVKVALGAVDSWLRSHPGAIDLVVYNVFGDADQKVYSEAIQSYPKSFPALVNQRF